METEKPEKIDRRVFSFFILAFPSILIIVLGRFTFEWVWVIQTLLALYQFILLRQFIYKYYDFYWLFKLKNDKYELYSMLAKRQAYQELQEAAQGQRIPPMFAESYSSSNAPLWSSKEARDRMLNAIASPLDQDIRRGQYVTKNSKGLGTVPLWQAQTQLPIDNNPLSRPVAPQKAIQDLRSNPNRLQDFIGAYGPGAAEDLGF